MPKWSTPKGKRQILIIGGLAIAGILLLVYFSKHGSSSSSSGSTNSPTAAEFGGSWNSTNTWSSPSGQPPMRHHPAASSGKHPKGQTHKKG
jgi:hypothetical protein